MISVCFRSEDDAVPLGRLPGVCNHAGRVHHDWHLLRLHRPEETQCGGIPDGGTEDEDPACGFFSLCQVQYVPLMTSCGNGLHISGPL